MKTEKIASLERMVGRNIAITLTESLSAVGRQPGSYLEVVLVRAADSYLLEVASY